MKALKLILFLVLVIIASGIDDIIDLMVEHLPREVWVLTGIGLSMGIVLDYVFNNDKNK